MKRGAGACQHSTCQQIASPVNRAFLDRTLLSVPFRSCLFGFVLCACVCVCVCVTGRRGHRPNRKERDGDDREGGPALHHGGESDHCAGGPLPCSERQHNTAAAAIASLGCGMALRLFRAARDSLDRRVWSAATDRSIDCRCWFRCSPAMAMTQQSFQLSTLYMYSTGYVRPDHSSLGAVTPTTVVG